MDGRYTVSKVQRQSLAKSITTFYSEMSVCNSCNETVIAIDARNRRYSIVPTKHEAYRYSQSVTLLRRETIGKSKESNGDDTLMDGIIVTISYFELKQSPVYVEEFDLMLCLTDDMDDCVHPYQQTTFESCLSLGLETIEKSLDDAPMFKILANDPTNNYDALYTLLNKKIAKIPVTHMNDSSFTMTIIVSINGRFQKETICLDDFISGKENTFEFENRVIPFVTTSELNAYELAKSFRWITMSTFNEMMSKKEIQYKAELEEKTKIYETKINGLKSDIENLNTILSQVKVERDDYKFKYERLRNDLSTSTDLMKVYTDREKYRATSHISDNDLRISTAKADIADKEAKFKLWHLCAAAAIPTAAAIILEILRSMRK